MRQGRKTNDLFEEFRFKLPWSTPALRILSFEFRVSDLRGH
jgi:hypothetical protein